jgi:hypothetical protein
MAQILLFFIIIVGGYLLSIAGRHLDVLTIPPSTQSAAVLEGATAGQQGFNETGTLVFYPNNVGPVPYLFYQDASGSTVAKALTFPDGSPSGFSEWAGARISITGHLAGEHVSVSQVAYVSPP